MSLVGSGPKRGDTVTTVTCISHVRHIRRLCRDVTTGTVLAEPYSVPHNLLAFNGYTYSPAVLDSRMLGDLPKCGMCRDSMFQPNTPIHDTYPTSPPAVSI